MFLNKSCKETKIYLDSKEHIIIELDSIYERLNTQIDEFSVFLRNERHSTALINQMNIMKLYRKKLENAKSIISAYNDKNHDWQKNLLKIQNLFDKVENHLSIPIDI